MEIVLLGVYRVAGVDYVLVPVSGLNTEGYNFRKPRCSMHLVPLNPVEHPAYSGCAPDVDHWWEHHLRDCGAEYLGTLAKYYAISPKDSIYG